MTDTHATECPAADCSPTAGGLEPTVLAETPLVPWGGMQPPDDELQPRQRPTERRLVHLVDDEEAVRRSAGFLLRTSGFDVQTYPSGVAFLARAKTAARGCILLDVRMPGLDGLEVQRELNARGEALPIVVLTGHGDVPIAVQAMRAGAVDFIEKPFEKAHLLRALEVAFRRLEQTGAEHVSAHEAQVRLAALTPRERDVLHGLTQGLPNKTIAFDLGISPRTVEVHRANLMAKLEVRSLSEALRLAFAVQRAG